METIELIMAELEEAPAEGKLNFLLLAIMHLDESNQSKIRNKIKVIRKVTDF